MKATHTFAILDISEAAYLEIRGKLEAAGYVHALHPNDEAPAMPLLDMHGIALRAEVDMMGLEG